MEEFEKLMAESFQSDLLPAAGEATEAPAVADEPSVPEESSSDAEASLSDLTVEPEAEKAQAPANTTTE
jgi:hypothetical protein